MDDLNGFLEPDGDEEADGEEETEDKHSLNSDLFPREGDGEASIFHREVLMTVSNYSNLNYYIFINIYIHNYILYMLSLMIYHK